jgi:DNA-binding Lrp family transcriptional regulator
MRWKRSASNSGSKRGRGRDPHCILDLGKSDASLSNLNPRAQGALLVNEDDAYAYVISANIHRRHLSTKDKDKLIVQLLQADPAKSNRTVAKLTQTSHPHVAKVREQAEKTGDVETVTTSIDTKGRQQPAKRKKPDAPKKRSMAQAMREQAAGGDMYRATIRLWRKMELPDRERLLSYLTDCGEYDGNAFILKRAEADRVEHALRLVKSMDAEQRRQFSEQLKTQYPGHFLSLHTSVGAADLTKH